MPAGPSDSFFPPRFLCFLARIDYTFVFLFFFKYLFQTLNGLESINTSLCVCVTEAAREGGGGNQYDRCYNSDSPFVGFQVNTMAYRKAFQKLF